MATQTLPHSTSTVLIADDHEDTRVILRHYFEAKGFEVLEAQDGEEALSTLRKTHPDVMVLDIQMPKMDGIEVLTAVRKDKALRGVRVLALSAHALSDEVQQIKAAGADLYLAKPADPKAVLAAVNSLIGVR